MKSFISVVKAVDRFLASVETALIVAVVAAMLVLTTLQVILKPLGAGVVQFEELARYLVIWVGFLGGAVAAYQARHINIDILTRFIGGTAKRIVVSLVLMIGVVITGVLVKTAVAYVADLKQGGEMAVSFGNPGSTFGVPEWIAAVVIPAGLVLIAWHMLAGALYAAADEKGPGHRGLDETLAPNSDDVPAATETVDGGAS